MEQRLIDANSLKARIQAWEDRLKGYYGTNDDMVITLDKVQKQIIDDMPTVDAVPVVRCGECKRWGSPIPSEMKEKGYGYCGAFLSNTHENEYCAWGERKDDEQIH